MGKSRRFGNDESFKSHRPNDHKKNKKGWVKSPRSRYSDYEDDKEINRRIRSGNYDYIDYDY